MFPRLPHFQASFHCWLITQTTLRFRTMATSSRKRAASVTDQPLTDQQLSKRQRIPETCEWILQEQPYSVWKHWDDASSPTLWIHGPSGSGKSYLTQYIIEDLKAMDGKSAVLSYFCSANSTPASVTISILSQLLHHPLAQTNLREEISGTLDQLAPDAHATPLDPIYRLWDKVIAIVEDAPPITLVIDGLDEMPSKYLLSQEFDFLARLMELTTVMAGFLRLLVSSRAGVSFRKAFGDSHEIEITPGKVAEDMGKFVMSEVSTHANLVPLKDEIVEVVVAKSEGIFQWATLAVKVLARQTTPSQLKERLDGLWKSSLDDLYASYFRYQALDLSPGDISIRDSIFRLMLFAVRQLRVTEIANFLSVELNVFMPDLETKAVEVCGGLVKTDGGILCPVHHSLRDFLQGEHPGAREIENINLSTGNLIISATLLEYLSHAKFVGTQEPLEVDNFNSTHSLAEYATLYWVHHASQSVSDVKLRSQIQSFISMPNSIEWSHKLLPLYLHRSVLPIPPRPFNTARFFHLFSLKSQIANCFDAEQKTVFDESFSNSLRTAYENALAYARNSFGDESLQVAQCLLDLAEVYTWTAGYQKRAPDILQEALELSSQLSSPEARSLVVVARQALADEYKRNGKYEEAQELLENLLDLAQKSLSSNDPKIMFALDSLGWVCMRRGQLELAVIHLQKALHIATELYGSHSPITLRSKVTLAEVLGKLGRHEEAEALCVLLKEQLRQHNENGAPLPKDSISHLNSSAMIYMQEKKYEEARDMYKVVVEDRRKLFGEEHRLTLWAEMQWGIAMDEGEDGEAAREVFESLIGRQEKILGVDHPDVKDVRSRLGRN
ncbi:NACHT and ankyrin domain protein [Bisporella sp. PMI_857]|nr:NACHT and ankyrin domain protein [Bisporella sp. PMI_857]